VDTNVGAFRGIGAAFLKSGLIVLLVLAVVVGVAVVASARSAHHYGWPLNASGLTYGSSAAAVSPQGEPDLIMAEATNGKAGYVYRSDLEEPAPSSLQEALRIQAARAGTWREIPVYLVDGSTKIGVFVIGESE
jgi:hypothetical protein